MSLAEEKQFLNHCYMWELYSWSDKPFVTMYIEEMTSHLAPAQMNYLQVIFAFNRSHGSINSYKWKTLEEFTYDYFNFTFDCDRDKLDSIYTKSVYSFMKYINDKNNKQ